MDPPYCVSTIAHLKLFREEQKVSVETILYENSSTEIIQDNFSKLFQMKILKYVKSCHAWEENYEKRLPDNLQGETLEHQYPVYALVHCTSVVSLLTLVKVP